VKANGGNGVSGFFHGRIAKPLRGGGQVTENGKGYAAKGKSGTDLGRWRG
jgi:hypothetical protein